MRLNKCNSQVPTCSSAAVLEATWAPARTFGPFLPSPGPKSRLSFDLSRSLNFEVETQTYVFCEPQPWTYITVKLSA